jgi:hypothetical protein
MSAYMLSWWGSKGRKEVSRRAAMPAAVSRRAAMPAAVSRGAETPMEKRTSKWDRKGEETSLPLTLRRMTLWLWIR